MSRRVLVSIVTYDSARYLRSCLESLRLQTSHDFLVCLWDNASKDDTIEIASQRSDILHTCHFSNRNVGFCAAHNRVIASEPSDYVLVLNPDVVLEHRFIEVMVRALDSDPGAGSATGKLWRWDIPSQGAPPAYDPQGKIVDTTGIYFTRNQRHLDRGSGESDSGQYERREYVFGASGAAAFYRRAMLESVQVGPEYFDEAFFAYREDADLAWRAQWLGWSCLYVPEARGFHARQVVPERRRRLSSDINMHSFKNRFLMRVKNMDAATYAKFFFPITLRDAEALAYVLLRERSSLRGIPLFLRSFRRSWEVRKALQRHRRASPGEIRSWFSDRPVSKPIYGERSKNATDA